jgi:membrane protein
LLVSLIVSAVISALGDTIRTWVPQSPLVLQIANQVISFCLITAMFAMMYKLLPDVPIRWKDVIVGAAATAVLFTLGKFLIALYLGHSSVGSAYGAAGSFVVFLIWIYYSSLLFFFGAEFTKVYSRRCGSHMGQPAANPLASQ